jgi:DNA-binding transcriptional LysR family regulator
MELRHLRSFVAIVEERGFTRAAARLRVTQPALSRQLRLLEDELGVSLLVRHGQGASPTAAGLGLLEKARRILTLSDEVAEEARQEGRRIRFGHYGVLILDRFAAGLRRFARSHPDLELQPVEMSSRELLGALEAGRLDFALVGECPPKALVPQLRVRRVAAFPSLVALSASNPLAKRRTLDLAELSRARWLGWVERDFPGRNEVLRRAAVAQGFEPRWAAQMDSVGSMLMRVAAGEELGLVLPMTRSLPHPGVVFSTLRGNPVTWPLDAAWPACHRLAKPLVALAQCLAGG